MAVPEQEYSLWSDQWQVTQAAGGGEAQAAGRFVEIVASFQTDYYISGLAPLGDTLVILAYPTPSPPEDDAEDPAQQVA
jgi:hypothetical protein